ncbi:DUF4919 domain-containing protein [Faecalibacter rhinopitheci]|uniref:DUF4919 domain-containing protein n=1 Tax=Faecalibacter rhinopitheci TaxID=2779678 RepID=A0A8J7FUZ7_9FLAO|nr:DUF4919 domain-containing protein [Faecalibacter rhinopitheci]MBF0595908.1 DUF4919 domain-containing protein [Faecalibacter rhinopitheci]
MRILLFSVSLFFSLYANAQFNIDLERIDSLTKDSTNTEFYFENLKEKFEKKPQDLSQHQLQVLYYQPINTLGSFKYDISTTGIYAKFKELNFKKFIQEAEAKLEEMPANLTILFLLSLAYGETKDGTKKANNYSKKFKLVFEAIKENKSLTDLDNLVELNCVVDEYIILQILGLDSNSLNRTSKMSKDYIIDTFEKNGEKIHFKILRNNIF